MKMIVRNPTQGIYPATGDYVHAIEVQEPKRFLYVAGTMGLDQRGVAGKNLAEQLDLIWSNIRVILASAEMSVDNIVRLTSYLRDPAYAEENAKARVRALNGRVSPTIGIVAQTLSSDWLVEIEVVAAA